MGIFVLNEGGRDPSVDYRQGVPGPESGVHAPVNHHAYAACSGGAFVRDHREIPVGADVLVLLRKDISRAVACTQTLKERGCRVFAAFKESGMHQVEEALGKKGNWEALRRVLACCDGALASVEWSTAILYCAGAKRVGFLPTPYPVDLPSWSSGLLQTQQGHERKGVFLGTREFDVPTRRTLSALRIAATLAAKHSTWLSIIDDGSCPSWLRKECGPLPVRWVKGPLPYVEYLRLIAAHRVVFQLDQSGVPGQVAGDCLLAGVLCVGGNGAVEGRCFRNTNGFARTDATLGELLERALVEDSWRRAEEEGAAREARENCSFASGRRELDFLFHTPPPSQEK